MKVLTRYILKLSIGPFLMGIFGFVVFASVELLYQLSDIIVRHRVSILKLFELIYYNLPYFVSLGIPVGVLFAIFWVLSQLYNSKEITALLVHGIPSKRLVIPFFVLSLVFGFFVFYLNDQIVPNFNQKAVKIISKYVYKKPELNIRENILTKIDDKQYFFVKKYDQESGILYDVVLFQNISNEERIITSEKVIKEGSSWYLINGRMYVTGDSGFLKLDMKFSKIKLDLKEDLESLMRFGKSPRDMTGGELKQKINTFVKLGIDPSPWIVELQSRYANSVGPFIIALLGVPLSLLFGLKSKSWSVILTFGIVVLYQGAGAWLAAMGKENLLNPYLASWLPNIAFGIFGTILFILLDTPFAYKVREVLSRFFIFLLFSTVILINTHVYANEITLDASQVEYFGETIFASGNVYIQWDDNIIISDYATFTLENSQVKSLESEGNVKYEYQGNVYYARYLKYFFDEDKAYVVNVKGVMNYKYGKNDVNLYFGAEKVTTYSASSLLNEAYITTCDLEHPHYKLESLNVYVYEGKYIIAENTLLFILDFPFFPYPIYFTSVNEKEKSPFSFSFSWSPFDGFMTQQNYISNVGDFTLNTSIETSKYGSVFSLLMNNNKTGDKFVLDFRKNLLELNTKNFIYKTNWDSATSFLKVLYEPFYFEESYYSESNWNKRIGFKYMFNKPIKSNFNFYIDYNGSRSLIYNSFNMKNFSVGINNFIKFKLINLDSKVYITKEGFFLDDSTWLVNENINYKFSLYNEKFFNTLVDVSYLNNQYISKINHKFVLPYTYKYGFFQFGTGYEFGLKIYNALTDKYYFQIGMYDKYTLSGKFELSPLTFKTEYIYRKNFQDESTSTNTSKLNFTLFLDTNYMNISVAKGWDFLLNAPLNDKLKFNLHFSLSGYEFNLNMYSEYDNVNKLLQPSNISFSISNSKLALEYKSSFIYSPGDIYFVKEINHNFRFQKFKGSITQSIEEDYIKRAYFNGSFIFGGFSNFLSLNYYKSSKYEQANFSFNYKLKVEKNSYSFLYSRDEKLKFGLDLVSFDPSIKFETTFDLVSKKFSSIGFSFSKKLHHWVLNFNSNFNFNGDGRLDFNDITELSVQFYVIEFSEKFFGWDFKKNQPSIGLF
ncbi:LptF/LptG family permease [Thermosipho atlanticus]|uniref:Lipopolysaccharide export LptBFGC system, permease protein LptF n=1 Tax=Thermosipho atlanticus DSM 15807 TaxID=1123380 RepID=A0A1M5R456_9BACT|nr:LptF/LptG family permease [Thermosipho atlanticus]SHH21187.1 Lipopolysaccharide export LptBFGC system, permease protein LptF [Thermosipho atlanticus DSM 15807]